ncbi:MAG: tetratricopeptide repeat protein [Planctomycetota bacterium]
MVGCRALIGGAGAVAGRWSVLPLLLLAALHCAASVSGGSRRPGGARPAPAFLQGGGYTEQRLREARATFQRGRFQEASAIAREILRQDPDHPEATLLLGQILFTIAERTDWRGRPSGERIAAFRRAREALERAEGLGARVAAGGVHLAIGRAFLEEGRKGDALGRLNAAVEKTPRDPRARRMRGQCLLWLGRLESAVEELRRAVELEPRDHRGRLLYADALTRLERPMDAIETLREHYRSIEKEPADGRHRQVLFEIYKITLGLNDVAAARQPIEEACRIAPGVPSLRVELGSVLYRLGEHERARVELEAALGGEGVSPSTRATAEHYLGLIAKHAGRFEEARRHLEEAVRLAPGHASALQNLGAVLRRLGEDEEARGVLERFRRVVPLAREIKKLEARLRKRPDQPATLVELIGKLIDAGRSDEARLFLNDLRQLRPGHSAIPGLEKRLQAIPSPLGGRP